MTYTVRITAKDLGIYEAKLGRDGLDEVINTAFRAIKVEILRYMKQATLEAGIPSRTPDGFFHSWDVDYSKTRTLRVLNKSPHAVYVEKGRRPNRKPPPRAAILPWVRQVIKPPADQEAGVVAAVANSIGKKGIRPRPVLNPPPSFSPWSGAAGGSKTKSAARSSSTKHNPAMRKGVKAQSTTTTAGKRKGPSLAKLGIRYAKKAPAALKKAEASLAGKVAKFIRRSIRSTGTSEKTFAAAWIEDLTAVKLSEALRRRLLQEQR